MEYKDYLLSALKFANESEDWGGFYSEKFYTTMEHGGWNETPDNAHGGMSLEWAFHQSPEKIKEMAREMYDRELHSLRVNGGVEVKGHKGTWYEIDNITINEKKYFLLEHEDYGDETPCVIVDVDNRLIADDIYNGFDEESFQEYLMNQNPIEKLLEEYPDTEQVSGYYIIDKSSDYALGFNPELSDQFAIFGHYQSTVLVDGEPQNVWKVATEPSEVYPTMTLTLSNNLRISEELTFDKLEKIGCSYITPQTEFYRRIDILSPLGSVAESLYFDNEEKALEAYNEFLAERGPNGWRYTQMSEEEFDDEPRIHMEPAPPYEVQLFDEVENVVQTTDEINNINPNKEDNKMPKAFVTDEQIQNAKQADLKSYVEQYYTTKPHGADNIKVIKDGHDSLVIYPDYNTWYDFNNQVGGDSIAFLMKIEQTNFVDAVNTLCGNYTYEPQTDTKPYQIKEHEPMELPPHAEDNRRAFAYLIKTRGLDRDIIKKCVDDGLIFQSQEVVQKGDKEMTFSNCIFIGMDSDNKPQYASQRSMNDNGNMVFKADVRNSQKEYGFCLKGSEDADWLTVCESPIDALSIASLHKMRGEDYASEHILSLGGVSDRVIDKFLETNDKIKMINICLDNDEAGHKAGEKIKDKYIEQGYKVVESYSNAKDYNLELKSEIARRNAPQIELPPQAENSKRSYMYLTATKQIDESIVKDLLNKGGAYQSNKLVVNPNNGQEFTASSTVFTARDKDNVITYAVSVGHNSKEGYSDRTFEHSNAEGANCYLSREGNTNTVVVYNNPISMLTAQSIENAQNNISGTSNQKHMICCVKNHINVINEYLTKNPSIETVGIAFDVTIGHDKLNNKQYDIRAANFNRINKASLVKAVNVTENYPEGSSLNGDYVAFKNKTKEAMKNNSQAKTATNANDNDLEH